MRRALGNNLSARRLLKERVKFTRFASSWKWGIKCALIIIIILCSCLSMTKMVKVLSKLGMNFKVDNIS